MLKIYQTFILTLLCFIAFPFKSLAQAVGVDVQTVYFLNEFRTDFSQAFLNKNIDEIIKSYSEEIRLMPEFQMTVLGKKNSSEYYQAFFGKFDIKSYEREVIEILSIDSILVELGYFDLKITDSQQNEFELKGKYQDVWRQSNTGEIKLISEAWNYNHSVDFADKLRFKDVPAVTMAYQPHLPVNSNITLELAALNLLMVETIPQKDAGLWSHFFTDDGMFIYSNNPIYEGRKELESYLEKHVAELPIFEKLQNRTDKIIKLNGFVLEYGSHIAVWRINEYSGVNTGKTLKIWRREKNGSLKIFRQMAMYD
jgi:ketosteroid isomerase-like protein